MALKGKNALITGGVSGIGLQTARDFLTEGLEKIILLDINEAAGRATEASLSAEFTSAEILFRKTDVRDGDQVKSAFQLAREKCKQLDIVVNAAAIYDSSKWKQMVDINLSGVIICTLEGLDLMSTGNGGGGGVIINISSIAGLYPSHLNPVYCATKFGVQALSRGFGSRHYFKQTGVRVVAMCPTLVETPMFHAVSCDNNKFVDDAERARILGAVQPIKADVVSRTIIEAVLDDESGILWVINGEKGNKLKLDNQPALD